MVTIRAWLGASPWQVCHYQRSAGRWQAKADGRNIGWFSWAPHTRRVDGTIFGFPDTDACSIRGQKFIGVINSVSKTEVGNVIWQITRGLTPTRVCPCRRIRGGGNSLGGKTSLESGMRGPVSIQRFTRVFFCFAVSRCVDLRPKHYEVLGAEVTPTEVNPEEVR